MPQISSEPQSSQQQQQQQQHVLYGNEYVSSELLAEFQQLQRRLKIIQADRRMQTLEAAEAARRQQADLQRLERENAELRGSLTAARGSSAQRERQSESRQLRQLLAELEQLEADVRRSREQQLQLDARLRDERKRLRQLRLSGSGGGQALPGAQRCLHESLVLHEKKLESRCIKYQTVVCQNAGLRESLDHLRADRQKFLAIRERLEADQARLLRRRADLTASATEAYREGEDARRRTKELTERERSAEAEHLQRVKLLFREIRHHDDIGGFVAAKWRARTPDPELRRLRDDLELRRLDESQRRDADDASLRRSFDLMRERYQAPDLDAMVRSFLQREDENFSLFRYCTDRQTEAAALACEVDQLAADIRRLGLEEASEAAGRSELLSELAGRLADVKADRLRRTERLRAVTAVLAGLAAGLRRVAGRLGLDDDGDGDGPLVEADPAETRRCLLPLLGRVEARVLDLLAVREFVAAGSGDPRERQRLGHRSSGTGARLEARHRRGTDAFAGLRLPDVDEVDVDVRTAGDRLLSERPLTKEQIVEKLQNEFVM